MDKDKVILLSKLARIEIGDAEAEDLAHEFEGILSYVQDVQEATSESEDIKVTPFTAEGQIRNNVLREDIDPHENGIYTDALLHEAPETEGQYIKVKKIL